MIYNSYRSRKNLEGEFHELVHFFKLKLEMLFFSNIPIHT